MPPAPATAEAGNAAPDTPGVPATCEVRDWPIFGPGHHKGELYTPERCRRMAANFARLRGVLVPTVKIGHDRHQRLAKSLGFVNAGRFAGVTCDAGGTIRLTLTGIPTRVGAQVNAGWLNSGSVELKSAVPDPADPAKKIPGDVIVGVALLGEEQPALPGYAAPRAVFADGAEVPPAEDADDWLTAMADVVTTMAAESRADADDPTTVICFSEMSPMTRDQIIQALMGKGIDVAADPELAAKGDAELKTLLDAVGTSGFSAGMKKMFAAGPDVAAKKEPDGDETPAYFSAFADECKKMFADLTGRVGAIEADKTMSQDAAAKEKDAEFSAEVVRTVEGAARKGVIQPWQKAAFVAHGKTQDRTKTFSDGPDKGKTEFAAWRDKLLSGATDKMFSDAVADGPKPGAVNLTPGGRSLLNTLKITNPRVAERLGAH
jgi:hypothetical protein